jgi:hypothetical protein
MFRRTNPEKRHGNMSGADFFYGTAYRTFGGGWSSEPSVSRVDDDIDVGKNLKSSCSDKPVERRLTTG